MHTPIKAQSHAGHSTHTPGTPKGILAPSRSRAPGLTFRNKFLLQRFIGFGQFSRPFRDDLVELLADSLLFAHGALLTPVRLEHASGCRLSSMRLWYRVVADTFVQWIRSLPSCVIRTMSARSTLTRRRGLQALATSLAAPF